MSPRKISRRRFWKDLTRTRHMTAVSAVVLGTTFMPLLGVPDVYELRAFQSAVEGFSDARAEVLAPRRNDEAARERSARSVIGEQERRDANVQEGADRMLTVERPEHQPAEMLDTAEILPLPPIDEHELVAPAVENFALPEVVDEAKPEAPPASEDEIMEDEEPAANTEEDEL
jgi:hypothetical protein